MGVALNLPSAHKVGRLHTRSRRRRRSPWVLYPARTRPLGATPVARLITAGRIREGQPGDLRVRTGYERRDSWARTARPRLDGASVFQVVGEALAGPQEASKQDPPAPSRQSCSRTGRGRGPHPMNGRLDPRLWAAVPDRPDDLHRRSSSRPSPDHQQANDQEAAAEWMPAGAHPLLQVRTRVLNDDRGHRLPSLVSNYAHDGTPRTGGVASHGLLRSPVAAVTVSSI